MAATTMNISVTPELRRAVERRVRSGQYGNASDVVRAGLRALDREESREMWAEWQQVKAKLPQDESTAEIEEHIAQTVRKARLAERKAAK
jgi:antitoxin ParD1/3/4